MIDLPFDVPLSIKLLARRPLDAVLLRRLDVEVLVFAARICLLRAAIGVSWNGRAIFVTSRFFST
jgi:hypothetical protein